MKMDKKVFFSIIGLIALVTTGSAIAYTNFYAIENSEVQIDNSNVTIGSGNNVTFVTPTINPFPDNLTLEETTLTPSPVPTITPTPIITPSPTPYIEPTPTVEPTPTPIPEITITYRNWTTTSNPKYTNTTMIGIMITVKTNVEFTLNKALFNVTDNGESIWSYSTNNGESQITNGLNYGALLTFEVKTISSNYELVYYNTDLPITMVKNNEPIPHF